MPEHGRIHLLCVGVNRYPNLSSKQQLAFCKNDAELIYSSYERYTCETKKLLIDSDATKENILCALTDIARKIRDNDYVIFAFAGHGFSKDIDNANSENSYIGPFNFHPEYINETGIKISELKLKLEIINTRHKLLLIDACHSGSALRRGLSDINLREISKDNLLSLVVGGSGYAIITACDSNESAEENSEIQQGVFTHSLIEVLKEGSEEYLAFSQVETETVTKVRSLTENRQNPQFKADSKNFTIPSIPAESQRASTEIQLDLQVLPERQMDELNLDDFKAELISLIRENRIIELDINIKEKIKVVYNQVDSIIKRFNGNQNDFNACYESCRTEIIPLKKMFQYLIRYGKIELIQKNFKFLLSFEKICENNGYTTILQIPYALISEIVFSLLFEVETTDFSKIEFIFSPTQYDYGSDKIPLIYNTNIWHPGIFRRSVKQLFEFIFPEKEIMKDIISKTKLQQFNELLFLVDSASKQNDYYTSFPSYYYFGIDSKILIYKLERKEYNEIIQQYFNLNLEEFLNMSITRQTEIQGWRGIEFQRWHSNLATELNNLKQRLFPE